MEKSITLSRPRKSTAKLLSLVAALVILVMSMTGCEKESMPSHDSTKKNQLKTAMRTLWSDHMTWTYATVNAFFNNKNSLQPTLNRLLQNQKDIGAAIVPFYGKAAGDQLANLLTTHIQQAVPVLQAAQAGDQTALGNALADWNQNAKDIANFLSTANPNNWPKKELEDMMLAHISTTVTYSVDLLKGDFQASISNYELANHHMMMMADMLADGIAKQFPDKF